MDRPVSKDIDGHLADDGKTKVVPFEAKTVEDVFKAHNKPKTAISDQCQCAHCEEHRVKKA